MIDEAEVQERLRRAVNAVADRANPKESTAWAPSVVPGRSSNTRNRGRSALVFSVGVALAIVVSAVVWTHGRSTPKVTVSATTTPISATTSTVAQKPNGIVGVEQTIRPVALPAELADYFGPGRDQAHLVPGTQVHGFSINGGAPFAVGDVASQLLASPGERFPARCIVYVGTLPLGGQGLGVEPRCIPIADLHARSMHLVDELPSFPAPPTDSWVWADLPDHTAFVTLDVPGLTKVWERPTADVAGFSISVPNSYNGPTDPIMLLPAAVLRAYDRDGNLLDTTSGQASIASRSTP
jgi:hypothetical protein